jgi:hypothetical protein
MAEFSLSIEPDHSDPARLDQLTRQLFQELSAFGGLSIDRPDGEAPEGAKSGIAATIGELLVRGTLSAGAVTALTSVLVAWIKRTGARSITVKRGTDELTVTGMSARDKRTIVDWFTSDSGEGAGER